MKKTILSIVTILLVFVAFGISSPKENTVNTKRTIENIIAGPVLRLEVKLQENSE